MRRRSRQRPRLDRVTILGACAVLAAAALVQTTGAGDRSAKPAADEAVALPSAGAPQAVASASMVERAPTSDSSRGVAPANAGSAGSPTGTRAVAAAHRRAAPRPAITLHDAAAIVRQSYGGNVVHSTAAPQPASENAAGTHYRIRVDVDGRVKTVLVDQIGRILPRGAFSGGKALSGGARGAGPSQNDNASTDH